MKSEGCDKGDVFGQKWYGTGRVLSSSVRYVLLVRDALFRG